MSISESLPTANNSSHLENFWKYMFEMGVTGNLILGGTESFAGT